jgi:hypothetical protein
MIVLILCLLLGMVLGQRFKVLVLFPTALAVIALTIVAEIVRTHAFWMPLLTAVVAATSLQIGYMLGLGIRHVSAGVRASRPPASSLAGVPPAQRSVR